MAHLRLFKDKHMIPDIQLFVNKNLIIYQINKKGAWAGLDTGFIVVPAGAA
jgi:hypothetical protein